MSFTISFFPYKIRKTVKIFGFSNESKLFFNAAVLAAKILLVAYSCKIEISFFVRCFDGKTKPFLFFDAPKLESEHQISL